MIEVESLTKIYDGVKPVEVLRSLDLRIERGEAVALIGPSGVGKTTLLNILLGKERPTAGSVRIGGADISRLDIRKFISENIGIVYQTREKNLLPHLTVMEMMNFVGHVKNVDEDSQVEILEAFGIDSIRSNKVSRISGGEAQRLALAKALVARPQLLLLDEPTGELDRKTSDIVMGYLRDYITSHGTTVLLVTHDRELHRYVDKTYRMLDGRIAGVRRGGSSEMAAIDRKGLLKIPDKVREALGDSVRLVRDEATGKVYLEVEEEEDD